MTVYGFNCRSPKVRIMSCQEESIEWHLDIFRLPALFPLPGAPGLTVTNQKIEGFIGEKTSINCFYQISGESKWCKLGGPCVSGSTGSIDGSKVTITHGPSVFTVTMSTPSFQHTGWYYCASGNLQMPVHLAVTQRPTTSQLSNYFSH